MNNKLTNKFEKKKKKLILDYPLEILDYPHWVDQSEVSYHKTRAEPSFIPIYFCFRSLNERLGDESLSR